MAEFGASGRVWTMRMLFVALSALILFLQLIPLETQPGRWPGPDLLVALVFVWALRRPSYVPFFLVAGVFLLVDLLLQRPPGLWAALVVLAVEWLKGRARQMREVPWTIEWMTAITALVTITVIYRLVLLVLFVPLPSLALTLIQMIFTAASIPVMMLFSRYGLGVHRAALGEVDKLGRRI
ncbi:hypothetical protein [Pseudaestuariivita atlantica]|uniref:Rod shape-determining protein MreD n=1 Tax=Pseudaestuariivita atlantica TaxID=1317121 RepID=A0A0L1JP63_9RHOB|nr:hypothetical protein [Pseudaestuariivita atlantica]KNG93208.1 hypothetical protein ATO11_12165 [Pseudaestuariivita atlantica]